MINLDQYQWFWRENDGNGNFSLISTSTVTESFSPLCTNDLDSDGDVDVVVKASYDKELIWYEYIGTPIHVDRNKINDPKHFQLLQNYPNPFNPKTTISFDVKELTSVILKIYNINGQLVSTLVDRRIQPGHYEVQFNAELLASGIYFYHIRMGEFKSVKKMIVLQ